MTRTVLDRLQDLYNVDVDDADSTFIQSLPFKPCNQTSNQRVISLVLDAPHNDGLLTEAIRDHYEKGWEHVLNRVSVAICVRNLDLITGRVLLQTSPRYLDNYDATLAHVREYAALFKENGVSAERYAIKIPFSGTGAAVAAQAAGEGIPILATSVFCLEQAYAASQAKCKAISPYFNEIAAKFDESLRPVVKDVSLEHPMSARVLQMLEFFARRYNDTKEEQPIMVIASHYGPAELLAMGELGCQHVTISRANMEAMMQITDDQPPVTKAKPLHPYAGFTAPERLSGLSKLDGLAAPDWDGTLPSADVDYLANDGRNLDLAINQDTVARKRLTDAMNFFIESEDGARRIIESKAAQLARNQ